MSTLYSKIDELLSLARVLQAYTGEILHQFSMFFCRADKQKALERISSFSLPRGALHFYLRQVLFEKSRYIFTQRSDRNPCTFLCREYFPLDEKFYNSVPLSNVFHTFYYEELILLICQVVEHLLSNLEVFVMKELQTATMTLKAFSGY